MVLCRGNRECENPEELLIEGQTLPTKLEFWFSLSVCLMLCFIADSMIGSYRELHQHSSSCSDSVHLLLSLNPVHIILLFAFYYV